MTDEQSARGLGVAEPRRPLERCPACGSGIPANAKTCPDCGRAIEAAAAERAGNGWRIGIVVGGLMGMAGLVLTPMDQFHPWDLFLLFFGSLLFFGCEIGEWLSRDAGDSRAGDGARAKGEDGAAVSENAIPNDDKE